MTIRLLLVDDQELVRTGLRLLLAAQPDLEVVGEAGDGAAGVAAARGPRWRAAITRRLALLTALLIVSRCRPVRR